MRFYCDNKLTISSVHNIVQHDIVECVEIGRYFIKEKLDCDLISTPCIPATLQLVDVLIEGLSVTKDFR